MHSISFIIVFLYFQIGPISDFRWQYGGKKIQRDNNIAIHVIPPDGEEDDEFVPPLRVRRKLSTPLSSVPGSMDGFSEQGDVSYKYFVFRKTNMNLRRLYKKLNI